MFASNSIFSFFLLFQFICTLTMDALLRRDLMWCIAFSVSVSGFCYALKHFVNQIDYMLWKKSNLSKLQMLRWQWHSQLAWTHNVFHCSCLNLALATAMVYVPKSLHRSFLKQEFAMALATCLKLKTHCIVTPWNRHWQRSFNSG